jgi:very-short-patch-repair endonuclease
MYRDSDQRNFARDLCNRPTNAEKRLWELLRAQQVRGHKFRRQAAIGSYIVDFVCFTQKLIIELDGPQHAERAAADRDASRTTWLASQGYRVLRFWNQQLDDEIQLVVDTIDAALCTASLKHGRVTPP